MKESTSFYYAGICSEDMGIENVTVDVSMFEEPFIATRDILELQIRGNDRPYFQGLNLSPLVLNLTFAFKETYDEKKIRATARWLSQAYYKPFYTADNPNRIFYCVLVGDSRLVHNGLKQGYVNLQMRCDSPYTYSPVYVQEYDLSSNNLTGTEILFENLGDIPLKPEIEFTKLDTDPVDIRIVNKTNQNKEFKFTVAKKARATLKISGIPANASTIAIGNEVYEFSTACSPSGDTILIVLPSSPTVDKVVANTVQAINANSAVVTATSSANKVMVEHLNYGPAGNDIAVISTSPAATWHELTLQRGSLGILNKETIYVDNDREHMESNLANTYRYDYFNDEYLELIYGVNRLQVYGNCTLRFRYQFQTLQG